MEKITSDYSLTKLFISKKVKIIIDNEKEFSINLPPIRKLLDDMNWSVAYNIWTNDPKKLFPGLDLGNITGWGFLKLILFNLGRYDKFRQIYTAIINSLTYLCDNFSIDTVNQGIKVNGITIDEEIWDYILSLVKLSYGEKVSLPPTFDSDEAREFYLAQKKNEERIAALRAKSQGSDPDSLIKSFLSITYAFPSFTFDYLYDQTLAQIQWLQKYAAGSVSYEVNAQAFAAGNVKKGKKLDFFIK